jgi:circadian clock protein KaiC
MRLLDMLKEREITALFTSLTRAGDAPEQSEVAISSMIDTWVLLRDVELNGERNRCIYVLKSRGMAHSNQVREFLLTSEGIKLLPAYIGGAGAGVLTGSSRLAQEARDKAEEIARNLQHAQRRQDLDRKRSVLQAQIKALQAELAADENQIQQEIRQENERERQFEDDREAMARQRGAEVPEESEPLKKSVGGDL